MIVRYADGTALEAILLARTETTIRAAVRGRVDALVLRKVGNRWTEDREPVQIEFAWQRSRPAEVIAEADCVCARALGERLIHLLLTGTGEEERDGGN